MIWLWISYKMICLRRFVTGKRRIVISGGIGIAGGSSVLPALGQHPAEQRWYTRSDRHDILHDAYLWQVAMRF